ncbi:glucokinase [Rhizobium sp. TH2]|uniref:glucokinase n=1 Tax=Rhizobium sp. TH2 TaxID=2775403 RepID=UPI0021574EAA|nr:glucokinase [Rhizobium sp. TH2]UVC09620.1 glucokinase [Rhizobium sp. TH2]
MAKTRDEHFPFPILIGDIGGTNARFSLLSDAASETKDVTIVQTASYPTIDAAIEDAVLSKAPVKPRSTILAVAGPINGDVIPLTNCPWVVRPNDLIANLGFEDVVVINDFEAQALAVATLDGENQAQVGRGEAKPDHSKVVLGPGTGLGVAGLVHALDAWIPVPGEGGHVDLGPRSARDFEIFPHIERIEGRVSAEQILCGRGLLGLYTAICTADGVAPSLGTPADVSNKGLSGEDRQAAEAISLFAVYLGRVAGDMAVVFNAKGGVYLSGGIPQKILPALQKPGFREAFEDKAPHREMMSHIPTFIVTHPLAAVAGLSAYARMPGSFGVSTDGRRWRK